MGAGQSKVGIMRGASHVFPMKTILTPVDFSAATRGVRATSIELARPAGGKIVLLHSVQPPVMTTDYGLSVELMRETLSLAEAAAKKQLTRMEKFVAAKGVDVASRLTAGFAAGNIVEQARKLGADYIVLGSHGHTAVYDLLVGSTTHAVLKKSPCPVVIVPPRAPKAGKRK
jgi:nucleotide-binding universal stress UspA family protein